MPKNKPVHNNFFMKTFQNYDNTRDFIKEALPTGITKKLDLSTIEIEPGTHVDESLKSHLSDLIIKMKTKDSDDVDLYFLFEHKSYKDRNILWQLLKYQYLMLEEDFKAKRDFRIIIPIVFYHGKGKWNLYRKFSDSLRIPKYFRKYVLNFEYFFYDANELEISDSEKFSKNAYLMSAISLMKHYGKMDAEKARSLLQYLKNAGYRWDEDDVFILLRYFVMTNTVDKEEVMNIIKEEFGDEAEELMPSLGRTIFNEGKEEGALEKAIETCRNLLVSGIDPKIVSNATGLSVKEVLKIQKTQKK